MSDAPDPERPLDILAWDRAIGPSLTVWTVYGSRGEVHGTFPTEAEAIAYMDQLKAKSEPES